LKRRIAEFLGVPFGRDLEIIRRVHANHSPGPTLDDVPIHTTILMLARFTWGMTFCLKTLSKRMMLCSGSDG
jgi:hypothetical protein